MKTILEFIKTGKLQNSNPISIDAIEDWSYSNKITYNGVDIIPYNHWPTTIINVWNTNVDKQQFFNELAYFIDYFNLDKTFRFYGLENMEENVISTSLETTDSENAIVGYFDFCYVSNEWRFINAETDKPCKDNKEIETLINKYR